MLDLSSVTLCAVDTRTPGLAVRALRQSMRGIRFAEALLFTTAGHVAAHQEPGIRAVPIDDIRSTAEYSRFMLRGLGRHVRTSHVLVTQWDGYVLDPGAWDPDFLNYDYVGAPWHVARAGRWVGNGGFSLRSRRLHEALLDDAIVVEHPEDTAICCTNGERLERLHGLRFAPRAVAARFSYERTEPDGPTFGFHGLFNMWRFMPPAELQPLLEGLPAAMFRGLDIVHLGRRLLDHGRLDEARVIVERRRGLAMRDRRSLQLRWRWQWAMWRRRWATP